MGAARPILGHVLLCSQASQDECFNHFTENHIRGNAEKGQKFYRLLAKLSFRHQREAKNRQNLFSARAPLRTPLGELTPDPLVSREGNTSSPYPFFPTSRLWRLVLGTCGALTFGPPEC